MPAKKSMKKAAVPKVAAGYTDAQLVACCGINCKICKAKSQRRLQLAQGLKESLQELPLDLFSQILPPYKNIKHVMEFLEFLPHSGEQTCCTAEGAPCGNPACEIRTCVKDKAIRTCAECGEYPTCSKLDFLKPFHPTLIKDLDALKAKGFDQYVNEVIAKLKLDPMVIS